MPAQQEISTIQGVHGSGLTRVAFSKDGQKVYSAGHDTHVRIWEADAGPDQDGKVIDEHEDPVTCLDCNSEFLLTGCEDAAVRQFDNKSGMLAAFLTRTDAVPVRCVAVDPKGEKVVVTSDETIFKIIDISDPTEMVKTTGHTSAILAASWDPRGVYLTTSGSDGKVMIWDLKHGEHPVQVKVMDIAPSVDVQSQDVPDITAVWHPSGKYFVLATKTNEITSFSRESWSKTGTFTGDGHVGSVTGLAFSPNGRYLATGGKDGQVIIWNSETRKIVEKMTPPAPPIPITCVAWSPKANLLAFADNEGSFKRWLTPIKSSLPDPFSAPPEKAREVTLTRAEERSAPARTEKALDDDDLFGDDFDMADFEKEQDEAGEDVDEPVWDKHGPAKQMVAVTPAQPPFQPGATPVKDNKRYLAWNLLGLIQSIDQGSYNYITVEFFDKTMRTGDRFQDYNNFTMASLGERGALYACPSEGTARSIIDYRPYRQASWAPDTRWRYELPKGEDVIAVAAGGPRLEKRDDDGGADDGAGCGNVVVATSKGYVRFFSGSGIQEYIWSVGADIVAVAAGEEWAFIVYRDGGVSLDGCQNLRYTLISFDSYEPIQEGRVPLMKRETLQWMGISEDGSPVIYDSAGVLHALQYFRRPSKGMWVPALDTNLMERRVGKQESYWPVGVSETEFHCVILKGLEEYPSPNKPPVTEHKLQMPLLSMEKNDKGEPGDGVHEEKIIRSRATIAALRDALVEDEDDPDDIPGLELEVDKALVWLIGKACLANKVQRAFDLCRKLQRLPSFDAAVQPARRYHHKGLEQRILALKEEFQDRDPQDDHRAQRQKWKLDAAPVEPTVRHQKDPWARCEPAPFNSLLPPAKDRSFLAPAIPTVVLPLQDTHLAPTMSSSSFLSRETSFVPETQPSRDDDSMDIDWPASPPANSKRKREESQATEEDGGWNESPPIKRKVSEDTAPKPVAKPKSFNPFARKQATTSGSSGSNNPFLRKNALAKPAETPVPAASTQPPKPKASKKSDAAPRQKPEPQGRQLTLSNHFGVPPPPPPPAPAPKKPRARKNAAKDKESETSQLETVPEGETQSEAAAAEGESQPETLVAPGSETIVPTDEATQSLEESQPAVESQTADDSPAIAEPSPTEEEAQQGEVVEQEDSAPEQAAESAPKKTVTPPSPGLSDKENRDDGANRTSSEKSTVPADLPASGSGISKLAAYKMSAPAPVVLTEAAQ